MKWICLIKLALNNYLTKSLVTGFMSNGMQFVAVAPLWNFCYWLLVLNLLSSIWQSFQMDYQFHSTIFGWWIMESNTSVSLGKAACPVTFCYWSASLLFLPFVHPHQLAVSFTPQSFSTVEPQHPWGGSLLSPHYPWMLKNTEILNAIHYLVSGSL